MQVPVPLSITFFLQVLKHALGHSEPAAPTSARMDSQWSGDSFLLGSSSLVLKHALLLGCTVQQVLDEEESKRTVLAQQNGFGPAFVYRTLRLAKV
jgi:hypothetical protein